MSFLNGDRKSKYKKSSREDIWQNKAGRLQKTRAEARELRRQGKKVAAHFKMLSMYITILSGGDKAVEGKHPVKFGLLALWHTFFLVRKWKELDHNQLDVLVQFLLKFGKATSFIFLSKKFLLNLAEKEEELTRMGDVKPHQRALALMTYAEVMHAISGRSALVRQNIMAALNLRSKIFAESDRMQARRQFVRILRKAGEMSSNLIEKSTYFREAKVLAKEVGTKDQVNKIQFLVDQQLPEQYR